MVTLPYKLFLNTFLIGRKELLHSFDHPDSVHYVALQPATGLMTGNLLATACQSDGLLRLFDMRRNSKGDIPPKSLFIL